MRPRFGQEVAAASRRLPSTQWRGSERLTGPIEKNARYRTVGDWRLP